MLRLKTILQYRYTTLLIFIMILFITIIRINIPSKSKYAINETSITGVISAYKIDGDKLSLTVDAKETIKANYYIKTETEKARLSKIPLGKKVLLKGTLTEATNNTVPNTFNYKTYLLNNDIYYVMNVENIIFLNTEISLIYKIKNVINDYIENFKSKGYLYTFVTGNKNDLQEGVYEQYQTLGVSHIFAISGMHVSILAGIIFKLLSKFKENTRYYIIIPFLLLYASITNYAASILRSISLYICLFLNKRFNFNLSTINVYYIAIGILLLLFPKLLFNVGFQYSALTSYSLIRYNYLIKGNYVQKCLMISIIAFLFSLPITVNNNYEINILSILNNLVFVPLITFIVYPLSLICLVLPFFDNVYFIIMEITELISNKLFVLNIIIPKLHYIHIILYYLGVNIFLRTYLKKYLILSILLIIAIKYSYFLDFNYYVYFLDVSQGDSTLIKYQDKAILIDTGGKIKYEEEEWQKGSTYQLSDNTIMFLKSIGITNIDHLLISHGDFDHMGEAIYLVNNFRVDKVIFNCNEFNELEQSLIKVLEDKKINYYSCIKELNINNNKLYFLNNEIYDNENDNSAIIYTELNNKKFLFMGDAGIDVEEDLLDKYNLKNIDILKVGHHGSKTSSSENFIDVIEPRYSIISVGKNNRYGHPNDGVLKNLENSEIYRTDQDGSIMFKIKKNKLEIETYIP